MGNVLQFRQKQTKTAKQTAESLDLQDRIERIKFSISRINSLMGELRTMSSKKGENK